MWVKVREAMVCVYNHRVLSVELTVGSGCDEVSAHACNFTTYFCCCTSEHVLASRKGDTEQHMRRKVLKESLEGI